MDTTARQIAKDFLASGEEKTAIINILSHTGTMSWLESRFKPKHINLTGGIVWMAFTGYGGLSTHTDRLIDAQQNGANWASDSLDMQSDCSMHDWSTTRSISREARAVENNNKIKRLRGRIGPS